MRLSRSLLCIAVATGVAGCAPGGNPPAKVDTKAEEAKLMDASRAWSALAAEGKDAGAVAAYWAEDAVLMQDNIPTIRGREAARQFVEGAFKMPGFKIQWEPIEAHVSASGDMGYIIERSTITEPGADGKPVTSEARAVTVWRKDAKGEWRNAVDISNAEVKAN
jgi:ketosteroid isomerase-like protein